MIRRFWRRKAAPSVTAEPVDAPADTRAADGPRGLKVRHDVGVAPDAPVQPFQLPAPPKGVLPPGKVRSGQVIAMDWSNDVSQIFAWAMQGAFQEGLGFLGYPYLAQLTQRAEYRRISEIIAKEMTRKWLRVTSSGEGKSDKVQAMEAALKRFNVQEVFRRAAEVDGFFGRAQIFIDTGNMDPDELAMPLIVDKRKIGKGGLKGLRVIEPAWTYPGGFNSDNPLDPTFYKPQSWFVNGTHVHGSRLLTLVMRELPDILKPAYAFGGLSMSQMAKPYVDNWLRTRQSVSDLLHSFSTMVLATDLSSIIQDGGAADDFLRRCQLFNQVRDNRGLMAINKDSEELTNVAAPLGSLDHLQAQSQEQMSSVAGIPLVVLLGITPSGLNASSDGEIRTFYASIASDQERFFRPKLETVFNLIQLNEFGEIDPELGFMFEPLWEPSDQERKTTEKTQAETDQLYINAGVVDPEEVRERLARDDESPYHGLDLTKVIEPPAPDPAEEPDPDEEEDDPDPAQDAWEESKHPRGEGGRFGEGSGGGEPSPEDLDHETEWELAQKHLKAAQRETDPKKRADLMALSKEHAANAKHALIRDKRREERGQTTAAKAEPETVTVPPGWTRKYPSMTTEQLKAAVEKGTDFEDKPLPAEKLQTMRIEIAAREGGQSQHKSTPTPAWGPAKTEEGQPRLVKPPFPHAENAAQISQKVEDVLVDHPEAETDAPVTEVRLSDLKTLQTSNTRSKVEAIRANGGAEEAKDLPLVAEYEGQLYLFDGNHRAHAAHLDGKETIRAKVLKLG